MDVLVNDDEYYEKLRNDRGSLIDEYQRNMSTYLKQCFPQVADDEIKTILNDKIKKDICPRNVSYIYSESKGNFKVKSGSVLDYLNARKGSISTPSGASFVQPSERSSIFAPLIVHKQGERKVVKKAEILYQAKGEFDKAMIKYREQLNIKTGINIFSGVMLSHVAYRSSIHYNAITSTARFGVMTGYAFTERTIADNYYFDSEDEAINWVVNLIRGYPGDDKLTKILKQYNLAVISHEELHDKMVEAVKSYTPFSTAEEISYLISTLTPLQVTYVYYAGSLRRIMFRNKSCKNIITDISDISNIPEYKGDIKSIFDLKDECIFILVTILLSPELVLPNGKPITQDVIDDTHPKLANRMKSLYEIIEKKLANLDDLMQTLVYIAVLPSNVYGHRHMSRRTVLMSDTDSVILTLIEWVEWYTGEARVSKEALMSSSVIVCILSKCFEHVFTTLLVRLGVQKTHMRKLVMKNEYIYSALIRTVIAKHYAGYIDIREGQVLIPPKLDLKGKNFISSTLCKETLENVDSLLKYLLDTAIAGKELSFKTLIRKAVKFEQRIVQSTRNGETTYLEVLPIKLKAEYAKPASSNFVYYELWELLFKKKYGELYIPQKCRVIPIAPITPRNYHLFFTTKSAQTGWKKFFTHYPKKKISRLFIPLGMAIPVEIIKLIDHNRILNMNCYSLQLILKSCNIITQTSFSDNYPKLAQELVEVIVAEKQGAIS